MKNPHHSHHMNHVYESLWIGEVWNKGNTKLVDSIFCSNFEDHKPIPQFPGNIEGHKKMAADWHQAFPDMIFKIQKTVIENNTLVGRYIAQGTHTGVILGIEATGAKVILTGIDIFEFQEGLVRHWWHEEDFDSFMAPIIKADADRKAKIQTS